MALIPIKEVGKIGVIQDISQNEIVANAWTNASNIRFLNGSAYQFYGHSEIYNSPTYAPQYLLPCRFSGVDYWVYPTASKTFAVTVTGGAAVHTDITHATPRTGVVNQWTGSNFGGIPILNTGDITTYPMFWDGDITHDFINLTNWQSNLYCKSLRSFGNFLIALNCTKTSTHLPYLVKWSNAAEAGTLPTSWDEDDATKDAGEQNIADGDGEIVDGYQLKDTFIIYKERSAHRMTFIGGNDIFSIKQVFGLSGIWGVNCVAEFDGMHFVITSNDVVIHDGYSASSVLDDRARRALFQDIDSDNSDKVFVFKNPFLNEVYIAYPSVSSTICDKALVYNYKDKTVTYRTLPSLNHAAYGSVDNSLANTWDGNNLAWDADLSLWNGAAYTPGSARTIMASADIKLFLLDGAASFDGEIPDAFLERRNLPIMAPGVRTLIKSVRPIIFGNPGTDVTVKIGGTDDDPYGEPTWDATMTYTIGTTISCDGFSNRRYPAIRFESDTAYVFRLDQYVLDVAKGGMW